MASEPVRVAVISDSHVPDLMNAFPGSLLNALQGVNLILHCGDVTTPAALGRLEEIAEVRAVRGNCDREDLCRRLSERLIVEVGGRRIGMTHGTGPRTGIVERVRRKFEDDVDLILFGHSHVPFDGVVGGVRMINPGACTEPLSGNGRTYVMLTLADGIESELREV